MNKGTRVGLLTRRREKEDPPKIRKTFWKLMHGGGDIGRIPPKISLCESSKRYNHSPLK